MLRVTTNMARGFSTYTSYRPPTYFEYSPPPITTRHRPPIPTATTKGAVESHMLHMLQRLAKRKAARPATSTAGGAGGGGGGGIETQSGDFGGTGSSATAGGGPMSPPSLRKLVSEDGGHVGHAIPNTPTEQSAQSAVEHSRPAAFLANVHSRESIGEDGEDEVRSAMVAWYKYLNLLNYFI